MKTHYSRIALLVLFILSFSFIANGQTSEDLSGDWYFDAPDAPEGSKSGIAEFKADTVTLIFDGYMRFPSDWVKAVSDSIIFETSFENDLVRFSLKIKDEQNLEGKAVWENGETPITFRRKKV